MHCSDTNCELLTQYLHILQVLSLAANPATEHSVELEQLVAHLHECRQEIDVAWRGM